jgi:hypothetical protein
MSNIQNQKKCTMCKIEPPRRHTHGKCTLCAKKKGYKSCPRCKAMFKPVRVRQRNCGKCFTKGKSVFVVASAGAPSLGRRR